jgi:hypothetical protein
MAMAELRVLRTQRALVLWDLLAVLVRWVLHPDRRHLLERIQELLGRPVELT